MIKGEHIFKSFDGRTILEDISVEFESGKTNLIIGRSGSGKTVLLKTLVGLHEPDTGKIFYDDKCYTDLSFAERKEVRRDVGMPTKLARGVRSESFIARDATGRARETSIRFPTPSSVRSSRSL